MERLAYYRSVRDLAARAGRDSCRLRCKIVDDIAGRDVFESAAGDMRKAAERADNRKAGQAKVRAKRRQGPRSKAQARAKAKAKAKTSDPDSRTPNAPRRYGARSVN